MDIERISGLGLEPMLATSELAESLGMQEQAIKDLPNPTVSWASPSLAHESRSSFVMANDRRLHRSELPPPLFTRRRG